MKSAKRGGMEMRTYTLAIVVVGTLGISGCAELTSIYRTSSLSGPDGRLTMIDAKQRVVFTKRGDIGDITCAEPSPDALTVFASSLSGSLSIPEKASAQIASALNETGANIGLRTPSIQLLRDVMYRMCEGYAGRAIDGPMFATLHRRYQNVMIGLLAIEQLTGATRPTVVTIGGKASADTGDQLLAAQKNLEAAQDTQKEKENAEAKAKTASETDAKAATAAQQVVEGKEKAVPKPPQQEINEATKTAEEAKTKAETSKKAYEEAQAATKDAEKNVAAMKEKRDAARAVSASAESVIGQSSSQSQPPPKETATEVAKAVTKIVKNVVEQSYEKDTCEAILLSPRYTVDHQKQYEGIINACVNLVAAKVAEDVTKILENNPAAKQLYNTQMAPSLEQRK